MFNKKNDPLVESVKAVMKQNEVHRQAEAALNEELGISSKKALPHEYHAQYDALLEAKVKRADEVLAGQRVRNIVGAAADETVKKIKGALSKKPKKPIDPYEEMVKREIPEEINVAVGNNPITKKDPNTTQAMEEKADYSPKQKKLARLGNAAGHGGNPEEIDEPDLSAARKGHAHKVGLEEKAVSKAQHRFFGLVRGIQKGQAHGSAKAEKAAKEMSTKEVRKFAKTKEKGLPERVDEAEGDVNPSEMTPISKGLQDRIVKDPPNPKPETKNMEEGVAMIRAGTAARMAYGTTKQSRTRIGSEQKEPNETTVGVMKSFLRRQEKKKDKSVAESVIDEIRENLEANLIAIHESGDDELFENYVNSLTEEELDILGLNEVAANQAISNVRQKQSELTVSDQHPFTRQGSAQRVANITQTIRNNPNIPNEQPVAKPQIPSGQNLMNLAKQQVNTRQTGIAMGDAGQSSSISTTGTQPFSAPPASNLAALQAGAVSASQAQKTQSPITPNQDSDAERASPGGGLTPSSAAPAASTSLPARDKDTSPAPATPAAPAAQPRQQQRPAPVAKPADTSSYGQRVGDAYRSGSEFTSRGERNPFASISESKQIKESLESFLRNRFLKG